MFPAIDLQPTDIMSHLEDLRSTFIEKRSIFVPGEDMILILSGLGATDSDLDILQQACSNLPQDPTLPFRRSRMGRFLFDLSTQPPALRRLENQPWVLSAEQDFVRFDMGQVRHFAELTKELQDNTAFQALFAFKLFMLQGNGRRFARRRGLNYNSDNFVSTVVPIRTTTTPHLIGEPALEGVHSDGVDLTMTTFISASNMTDHSAETTLHDNQQKNATRHCDTDPRFRIGTYQHRNFLDTLIFFDHERKHSLGPVEALDKTKIATRDMFVFVTRKPAMEGHICWGYDSMKEHEEIPLAVGLGPGLQDISGDNEKGLLGSLFKARL